MFTNTNSTLLPDKHNNLCFVKVLAVLSKCFALNIDTGGKLGCSYLVRETDISVYHLHDDANQGYSVEFDPKTACIDFKQNPWGIHSQPIRLIPANGGKVTPAF